MSDPRTECDFIGSHLMNGSVCDRCGFTSPKEAEPELREEVITLLGLEESTEGKLSLSNFEEDIVSDWNLAIQELMQLISQHTARAVREARRDELLRAAPHQVALHFEIPASELNSSWYLDYIKYRDNELKEPQDKVD